MKLNNASPSEDPRDASSLPPAAEAALPEALEAKFASVLIAHMPVTVYDTAHRMVYVNDAFCALTKYPREELLNRPHNILDSGYHPPEYLDQMWNTASSGRIWKGDIRKRAKDGTFFWVDITLVPIADESGKYAQFLATYTHITSVKQLQQSLAENEKRYYDLVQLAPDAIFLNEGGATTYVNEAGIKMLRAKEPEEIVGRPPHEFFRTDCREEFGRHLEMLLREPTVIPTHEHVMLATDGTEIHVEMRSVSYVSSGRIIVQAACRNISERKTIAHQLQQERDYANAILNSLPGIFYQYDENMRLRRWNNNLERITGYSPEELNGFDPLNFFEDEQKELIASRIREVLEKGESSVEADYRLKDGTLVPYMFTGVRFDKGFVGVGTDISAAKQVEDSLREALFRFHAAARATKDVLWDWDLNKRLIWRNENYADFFGKPADKLDPEIPAWFDRIHPEDRERVRSHLNEVWESEQETWTEEYRYLRGDDTYRDVYIRGYVMRDESGRVVRMLGALQDITERKRTQTQLLSFNAELEERVALRTRELQILNQELESFSYSVSHDLRAPLRAISGFVEILAANYADAFDDKGRNYLSRVLAATQRMSDLIDDLLNLSRVTRSEMSRETVNLSLKARSILDNLQHSAPERKVQVVIEDGLTAEGDPRLLLIMLENLLGNAWKFTSKTPAAQISFTAVQDEDGSPAFAISDNGAGFEMRYANKLFGAFQRLHRATEFPGTGIGLAIVYRVVTRHGGRITAHAELNKGATFRFTLG